MSNNATRYTAQAVSFQLYEATETKAAQIGVELRVTEGPEAGKTLYYYGSLHENAQQYTAEALRNMGWTCNDITSLEGLGSLKVVAVEKKSEYKGKVTTQWMIFPVKTPRPTIEGDAKATFAAQFKALAASVAAVKPTEQNQGLALAELPPALPRNGTGTTAPSDGPATGSGGVPF